MKKGSKSKSKTAAAPRVDPYLEGLMAKLLERLVGLERKMDTVIAQLTAKPSGNGDPSKPLQPKEPSRRDRVLFEAICADCHKVCEVPFKPAEGRAVYCKECFAKRRLGGSGKTDVVPRPIASPKPVDKPSLSQAAVSPTREMPKKAKKRQLAKKAKKK